MNLFDITEELLHKYQGYFVYPDGKIEARFKDTGYIVTYPEDYGKNIDAAILGIAVIIKEALIEKGKEVTHEEVIEQIKADILRRAKPESETEIIGESK